MLSEEEIRMIYQQCRHDDPHGLYSIEIDILEFSRKLEAYLAAKEKQNVDGSKTD